MNPDQPSREEIEVKLTALLLGELPANEAKLLRWTIAHDAQLKQLHDRLKLTIGLVREVSAKTSAPATDHETGKTDDLKLSESRRGKLLAQLQTPSPNPLFWLKRIEMPRLIPILAVVALMAVLAAMLLPSLASSKKKAQRLTTLSGVQMKELQYRTWGSERREPSAAQAVSEPVDAAPTPPDVVTVPPSPMLAPPPTRIVLPSAEPAHAATIVTGSLNDQGNTWNVSGNLQGFYGDAHGPVAHGGAISYGLPSSLPPKSLPANSPGSFSSSFSSGVAMAPNPIAGMEPTADADSDEKNTALDKSTVPSAGVGGNILGVEFRQIATNSSDLALNWPARDRTPAEKQSENISGRFAANDRLENKGTTGQTAEVPLITSGLREEPLRAAQTAIPETTPVNGMNPNGDAPVASPTPRPGTSAITQEGISGMESVRRRQVKKTAVAPAPVPIQNSATVAVNGLADAGNLQAEPTPNLDAATAPALPPHNFARLEAYAQAPQKSPTRATGSDGDSGVVPKAPAKVDELNGRLVDRAPGEAAPLESKLAVTTRSDKDADQIEPDAAARRPSANAPVPQPEILTRDNAFSTFSLNVSDVSFKLAAASLEKGQLPDPASIRSEEFINAFDYRDPEAAPGEPIAFATERARYPFAQNRDLLRFSLKTAAAGRPAGRALNLVLLLDNSGSMERADRVQIIRAALAVLTTQLQPQDTVSVVTFARTARLWLDGASGTNAGAALEKIGELTPQGGTNLEEAMRLAYETARRHYQTGGLNRVVMLTDGAANLGNVDATALTEKVEANRRQGIALDCFGIGWEGLNDDLLEQLTRHGDGRYAFINTPEEATQQFAAKLAGALQIAAADVKVQVEFNPQRVVSYRQIGYAKHQLTKEQFRDNTVDAAEIAAQEAGNALYTVETKPDGSGPVATVRVRYKVPGTTDYRERSWDVPYTGNAVALAQASPALRLAATASAFSEWLAASPFAQEISPTELTRFMAGVPEIYGADERPKQLALMLLQAKSLAGK